MDKKIQKLKKLINAYSSVLFPNNPDFKFLEINSSLTAEEIKIMRENLPDFEGGISGIIDNPEGLIDTFIEECSKWEAILSVHDEVFDKNGQVDKEAVKRLQYFYSAYDDYDGDYDGDLETLKDQVAEEIQTFKKNALSNGNSKLKINNLIKNSGFANFIDFFEIKEVYFNVEEVVDISAIIDLEEISYFADDIVDLAFDTLKKDEYGVSSEVTIKIPDEASKTLFKEAAQEIEAVTNLKFNYLPDKGYDPYIIVSEGVDFHKHESPTLAQFDDYTNNGAGLILFEDKLDRNPSKYKFTYVHEIGHALGLEHSFGSESLGNKYYTEKVLPISYDNQLNTVMSYTGHPRFPNIDGLGKLDILALQHKFGVNVDHNSQNTYYDLKETNMSHYRVIDDQGGVNFIDLSSAENGSLIDLREGLARGIELNSLQGTRYGLMDDVWATFVRATDQDDLIVLGNDTHTLFTGEGKDEVVITSEGKYVLSDFSKKDKLKLVFPDNSFKIPLISQYDDGIQIKFNTDQGEVEIAIPVEDKKQIGKIAKNIGKDFEESNINFVTQERSGKLEYEKFSLEYIINTMQEYSDQSPGSDSKINAIAYNLGNNEERKR